MQCQLRSPTRFCFRTIRPPVLFFLYVNDLSNVSKFEVILFADDTNLHLSHNNIKSPQMQTANEVDKTNNWINSNKLTINYKIELFYVGRKQAGSFIRLELVHKLHLKLNNLTMLNILAFTLIVNYHGKYTLKK